MSPDELRAKAEQLERLLEWMSGSYVYLNVEIEQDDYYLDFGCLGEQSLSVTLQDDKYEYDPQEIFNDSDCPAGPDELNTLVELARDAADRLEAETATELEPALRAISVVGDEQDRKLAEVMLAVLPHLRRITPVAATAAGAPQPLPDTPLPWPGSDVEGVDYTAEDFPARYQPPPGWTWSNSGQGRSDNVDYEDAEPINVSYLGSSGTMILTKQGRISWKNRDGDDLADGVRWRVWEADHGSGVLSGFNSSAEPRAVPAAAGSETPTTGGFAPPAEVSV